MVSPASRTPSTVISEARLRSLISALLAIPTAKLGGEIRHGSELELGVAQPSTTVYDEEDDD